MRRRPGAFGLSGLTLRGGLDGGLRTRNKTRDPVPAGLWVGSGDAVVSGLVIRDIEGVGAVVTGRLASLDWRGGTIRETSGDFASFAPCLFVDQGGTALVEDSTLEDCSGIAVLVQNEDLTDEDPSALTLRRSTLARSVPDTFFEGAGLGVLLSVTDVTIHGAQPVPGDFLSVGLGVVDAGRLEGTGVLIEDTVGVAVTVQGEGTALDLKDLTVINTRAPAVLAPEGTPQTAGVAVLEGAQATVEGLKIRDVDGHGTYVVEDGTQVVVQSATIQDVAYWGALIRDGASLDGQDLAVQRPRFGGLFYNERAVGTLEGVDLSGLSNNEEASLGAGLVVQLDSTVQDTTIAAGPYGGAWINGPGRYELVDSTLSGGPQVELAPGVVIHGDALYATNGVQTWDGDSGLRVVGSTLLGAQGAGLFLQGASATLESVSWADNSRDVVQQVCDPDLAAPEGLDDDLIVDLCPAEEVLVNVFDFSLSIDVPDLESE